MLILESILSDKMGSIIISVIIGLGIASMFRKVCKDRNCIVIRGVSPKKIKNKVFEWNDKCYKYRPVQTQCDKKKNIIKEKS